MQGTTGSDQGLRDIVNALHTLSSQGNSPGTEIGSLGFLLTPGVFQAGAGPMGNRFQRGHPVHIAWSPGTVPVQSQDPVYSPSPRPYSAVGRTPPSTCQWGPAVQGPHSQKGPWKSTPDALIFSRKTRVWCTGRCTGIRTQSRASV